MIDGVLLVRVGMTEARCAAFVIGVNQLDGHPRRTWSTSSCSGNDRNIEGRTKFEGI